MNSMPKVSVVITNKDYNQYLSTALKSLLRQSYAGEIEIIVVDDNSKHKDFQQIPSSVSLIYLSGNNGQAKAANTGFSRATGKYFMRMDADDWLSEYCIATLVDPLVKDKEIGFSFSDYWEYTSGELEYKKQTDKAAHGSVMLIRASLFNKCQGYDETLDKQEDYQLLRKLKSFTRSSYISLPLWYYRIHEEQKSKNYNSKIKARQALKDEHEPKVLAVIPARGGSKGVPGKNLYEIDKKSLVARSIELVKRANIDALIVVTTDDEHIAEIAKKENVNVIMESEDAVGTIPATQNAVKLMGMAGWPADIVITVSPACPYTPSDALSEGLDMLIVDNLDSVVSISKWVGRHPYRAYELGESSYLNPLFPDLAEKYLQRQDRPQMYQFTGGFYIRRSYLLKEIEDSGFCLGENWKGVVVKPEQAIDIDTPMDLWLAESIQQHLGGEV